MVVNGAVMVIRVNDGAGVAYRDGRFGAAPVVGPRCARLYTLVFKLTLVDTHRDYVNGPNEMHEVLDQLFQANLISKNSKSPQKTFEIVWKM